MIPFIIFCVLVWLMVWDFLRRCKFRPYRELSDEDLNVIYQTIDSETVRSLVADEIVFREKFNHRRR